MAAEGVAVRVEALGLEQRAATSSVKITPPIGT